MALREENAKLKKPTTYTDENVTLMIQGDCLEQLRRMGPETVDVIVTSPPYNIGKKYSDYDEKRSDEEFLSFMGDVAEQLARVVKADGHVFVNVGYTNIKPWTAMDVAGQFRCHFILQNQFTWVKSIAIHRVTTGNFKPINSKRFVSPTNESVFHFTLTGKVGLDRLAVGVPMMDKVNLGRFGHKDDIRCRGNTWFVPYTPINNASQRGGGHPASFPIDLPLMCIKLTGKTAGVVLDPFVGSGTTMKAALHCGMKAVGIDISPMYLAEASPEKVWPPRDEQRSEEHEQKVEKAAAAKKEKAQAEEKADKAEEAWIKEWLTDLGPKFRDNDGEYLYYISVSYDHGEAKILQDLMEGDMVQASQECEKAHGVGFPSIDDGYHEDVGALADDLEEWFKSHGATDEDIQKMYPEEDDE